MSTQVFYKGFQAELYRVGELNKIKFFDSLPMARNECNLLTTPRDLAREPPGVCGVRTRPVPGFGFQVLRSVSGFSSGYCPNNA